MTCNRYQGWGRSFKNQAVPLLIWQIDTALLLECSIQKLTRVVAMCIWTQSQRPNWNWVHSEHTGLYTVQQTSKLQMLLTRPGWKTRIKAWRKINQPLRKEDQHYSTYYFNCLVWSELCHCCQLNLLQLATYNWKDTLSVILSFSYMQTWTSKEHTKEDPIA
jgi:hypothetical protein